MSNAVNQCHWGVTNADGYCISLGQLLLVPNMINSVLSSLSFNILDDIHCPMSSIHVTSWETHSSSAPATLGWEDRYTCWSSVYSWYVIPWLQHKSPRGTVYKVNRLGPKYTTLGNPKLKGDWIWRMCPICVWSPIMTHCNLLVRYECILLRAVPEIPKQWFSWLSKIEWFTLWKAADKLCKQDTSPPVCPWLGECQTWPYVVLSPCHGILYMLIVVVLCACDYDCDQWVDPLSLSWSNYQQM